MLKGIDPILNADLLHALRAMGHGDDLVLADANFPATTMARRLIRMDGVPGPRLLKAILSVLPIDDFVPDPAVRIEALLTQLAALDAVRFLRNGQSHSAADAVQHLRQKWAHQRASVRSVEDFIVRCASVSEWSGEPYRLQWPDGRLEALADYLRAQAGLP